MPLPSYAPTREQYREEVRRRLEMAALELFAERGYHQVTVAEVAAHAGVTARTVFRHFSNKEDLLLAMPRRSAVRLQMQVQALEPSPDPVSAVWDLLVESSRDRASDGEIIRLWSRASASAPETMARMRGERAALVEAALTEYFACSLGLDPVTDVRPSVLAASLHAAERAVINKWAELQGEPELSDLFRSAYPAIFGQGDTWAGATTRRR